MLPPQEDRQQQQNHSGASSSGKPAPEGVWRPKRVEEAQQSSHGSSFPQQQQQQQSQQSRYNNVSENRRQHGRGHNDGPSGGDSQSSSFSPGLGPEQRRDFSGISSRDDHASDSNYGMPSNMGVVGPTREFPRPDLLPAGASREFPRPSSDNSAPSLLPSDSTRDFGGFAASLGPPSGRMGGPDGPSASFSEDPENRFARAAKESKQQVLPLSETRDVGQWGPSDFGGPSSGGYGGEGFGSGGSGGRFGNESGLGGDRGQSGPYGSDRGQAGMAQQQLQRGWNVGLNNGPFGGPGGPSGPGGGEGGGGGGGFSSGGGHSFGGGSYGRGEGRQGGDSRGGGGSYGDSRGSNSVFGGMRRPGEERSERVNPMGKSKEISVQTRYQQNLIDLIAKPEKESAGVSQDGRPRLALTRGGAPIDSGNNAAATGGHSSHQQSTGPSGSASGTSVVGQGRSGSQADQEQSSAANLAVKAAAMFGDEIALATLKTNLVRVIDDFMAAFGKDAPKRSAKELAGLAGGDKNKLRYSIYILADHAFKFEAPGERQQLAGLAVALLAGTKKEPAAATQEDIAEGLEQALELSDKLDSSRQRFFTFLEELVKSKGGLPEAKLGSLSKAAYAEKPAPVVEAADESEIAEAEAATKSAQVAAPQAPRLTQDEMYAALEDVKLVAARVLSSGLIGSEIVSIARDAFTKYSKAEAASALVDEILKVSTFFPLSVSLFSSFVRPADCFRMLLNPAL